MSAFNVIDKNESVLIVVVRYRDSGQYIYYISILNSYCCGLKKKCIRMFFVIDESHGMHKRVTSIVIINVLS